MSIIKQKPIKYDDGMTKQAFKESTDINRLLARHARAGTLSHLEQFGGQYGDFDFDFQTMQNRLAEGKSIFERLPAEVRREFKQDPTAFFAYVNERNAEELKKELPELAKPGNQMPNMHPKVPPKPPSGGASEPQANENPTPAAPLPGAGS